MHEEFIPQLHALMQKHGVFLHGNLRFIKADECINNSQAIAEKEYLDYSYAKDRNGPFLEFDCVKKPYEYIESFNASRMPHWANQFDKDALLKDGVKSMADGKTYTNRKEYNDHLKARGMVEVGNDWNNQQFKQPEIEYSKKDMDAVRHATGQAINEVFDRKGIR